MDKPSPFPQNARRRRSSASIALFIALTAGGNPSLVSAFATTGGAHHRHGHRRRRPHINEKDHFLTVHDNQKDLLLKWCGRDIDSFQEWAFSCGVQCSDGLELTKTKSLQDDYFYISDEDVSVRTLQAMEAKSPVLFVPGETIISSSQAMAELGESLQEAEQMLRNNDSTTDDNLIRNFYIMMKLLLEWQCGTDSPWYPYLNYALPQSFDNGASMTPVCYKSLPPHAAALAQKERATYNRLSAIKRVVPFLDNDTKGNAELWKWAFSVVYTRSIPLRVSSEDNVDLCLIPMFDMFNHNVLEQHNNIEFALDEYGNCHVQTNQEVEAGAELCRNYYSNVEDDLDNRLDPSFLLARYGFVDHSSPALFCKWIPPHVNDDLRQLGYAPDRMLFYKETGDVASEVWDVLLYRVLAAEEEAGDGKRQQLVHAHVMGDHETKQWLHEQYFSHTLALLGQHVESVLQDLEELSQKIRTLRRDKNTEHPRLPLLAEHKKMVQEAFRAVQRKWLEEGDR